MKIDMQFRSLAFMSLGFSALLCGSSPISAQTPALGTARNFAALGGSTVTNVGATTLVGDLGISPGTGFTGFPPGLVVGTIHAGDAVALQAQIDLTRAYDALVGTACTAVMTGQDLGGLTLTPGVFCFAASAPLNGVLTLDALGNPDAVFVFQIGSTLLAALDSSVLLINGARPDNVFWQVGSSATLGAGVSFAGNVLAHTSITLSIGSSVSGRALARTGAVTMDNSSVTVPAAGSCGSPASIYQIMAGCGGPTVPILSCTPPVMGVPAHLTLEGSPAFTTGFIRLSPWNSRFWLETNGCMV